MASKPKSPHMAMAGKLSSSETSHKKLTKLLVIVTIERSLGPIQVVVSAENTVNDLIRVVLEMHVKEKRRPLLEITDPRCYELHYSQFTLENLDREEKLINLGSRNFYLCSKTTEATSSSKSSREEDATLFVF